MDDAPERIWMDMNSHSQPYVTQGPLAAPPRTEYIRADTITAERDRLREALEELACRHVTEKPLWWQQIARAALKEPAE